MKLRLLSMAGFVALTSAFVIVGCGDDDSVDPATGGHTSGGKSGSGGKAGSSGKGGTTGDTGGTASGGEPAEEGGSGGTVTAAGSGGKGGSPAAGAGGSTAGSGGKAGSAGTGGTAGVSGGAGGAGGSTAGAGGALGGAGGSTAGAGGASGGAGGSTAGAGGASGGAGGASGGAGGSTAGAGGSMAGAGGSVGGSGGSGGSGALATGCTKLTAPFATTGGGSGYVLSLGAARNLATATISASVYAPVPGSATNLQYMFTGTIGTATCTAYSNYIALPQFASGFAPASLAVSSVVGSTAYCDNAAPNAVFDGLQITSVGVVILNSATATAATATVWLDSLAISSATPAFTTNSFDAGPTPFTIPGYPTVSGAAVAWQASCP